MTRRSGRRSAALRLLAISVLVAAAALVASHFGPSSTQELRDLVGGRWWGPVLFVVIAVALVVLAVHGTLMTIAAGVLYGPITGSVLALVTASIGATVAFATSRRFGRAAVESMLGPRSAAVDARLGASG